ncbi:MAG: AcrB/AcrD/AcrF family protein, partial [Epsilonproteobacteria bacterium]
MTNQNHNIAGKLASTFINHPLTFILGIFILALGYMSLEFMPREENPQIKVAGGAVIVPMPGAKADEIQKIIIEPLEQKIRQIKGVENIFSIAKDSVGIVQVQYLIGQDKGASDLKLYDQVMKNMDQMPKNAMQPIIKTMDIDVDIPVASVAFYSKDKNLSEVELYKKVNRLAYHINKMDDVAQIDLKGEKKEQYNILIDSKKLSQKKVTLGQVAVALKGLTFELPDIKADKIDGEFVVFGIDNALQTSQDLGNVIVDRYVGRPVLLKDIATITKGYDIQHEQ